MAKRLFDLTFALLGLALLWPILLIIAVWVKLDSTGPAFFKQERVGRHGRMFRIYKFRTMSTDRNGSGLQLTVGADPRITRAGSFLRRYKLDELPQLLNVVRGEMSLVGPRPEVPRYVAHYSEAERVTVLSVRPGITDPASIAFVDENALLAQSKDPEKTYLEVIMPQKLRAYEGYVVSRSLVGDLIIIMRTLRVAALRTDCSK